MRDLALSLEEARHQGAEGCVKIHSDLDRYRVVINRVAPDLVVECGTFSGKSACWFAETASCHVVTVDRVAQVDEETYARGGARVTWLVGDTTDASILEAVRGVIERVGDLEHHEPRVMVVLDSDHSCDHVLRELVLYTPLVSLGSYCVVEDGILHWMDEAERAHYIGDPIQAIDRWLAHAGPGWVVDRDLEDLHTATLFPKGWLRRVA